MSAPVRTLAHQVAVGGTTRTDVESVSWSHGVALSAGDVLGGDASAQWGPASPVTGGAAHPLRPGWDRDNGAATTIDIGGVRVFTGVLDSSAGTMASPSASSKIVDALEQLTEKVSVAPCSSVMPPSTDGGLYRRVELTAEWATLQAMQAGGFNPVQPVGVGSVYYQSFCGSCWLHPDPSHATATLGRLVDCHRKGATGSLPVIMQGKNVPGFSNVLCSGWTSTTTTSSSTPWRLTVDLATVVASFSGTGRVSLQSASTQGGIRLEWNATQVRVYTLDTVGSASLRHTATRGTALRWTLTAVPGTNAMQLKSEQSPSVWTGTHTTSLPTGGMARVTVDVDSSQAVSAVQVCRGSNGAHETAAVTGTILRGEFDSLTGTDYIEPREALGLIAEIADAQRSLRGMPLWVWLDPDGVLQNVDPAVLAPRGIAAYFQNEPHATRVSLDDVGWALPSSGRVAAVELACRVASRTLRTIPRVLGAVGPQEMYADGDAIETYLHPDQDQTWLEPDLHPIMMGHPQSSPYNTYANREIKSQVGGHVTDAEGDAVLRWLQPEDVDGWSLVAGTSSRPNRVVGAFQHVDHRSVLVTGTINVASGEEVSSMPHPNSVGLPARRKTQALPQLRCGGELRWREVVARYPVPGVSVGQTHVHDAGQWVQSSTHRRRVASILAQAQGDPAPVLELTTALDPGVRVGEKAMVTVEQPEGELIVTGLVAGVSASFPSSRDQMGVTLVALSATWIPAGTVIGYPIDYGTAPVLIDPDPPRGTEPVDPL